MKKIVSFKLLKTIIAVLLALALAFLVIISVSDEPTNALGKLLFGPLSSLRRFSNVLELSIPLIFTGLAVCVMFEAKQFNMMSEGSFFIGAIAASYVAINFKLPYGIHPIVAVLVGGIVGGLSNVIPALLKSKYNGNELVSSLMMNHVALLLGLFAVNKFMRDPNVGTLASFKFQDSAKLPRFIPKTRIHMGIFIAILMVIVVYHFLYKTKWGYALRMTGHNIHFSQYSGIKTYKVILFSQIVGGIIAGIGGATEMLGMYSRFEWHKLTGYGWDGIIVAILAKNNPILIPIAAFFLAYIRTGADIMARTTDVASEIVSVIQALIIMLITAEAFMAKWQQNIIVKQTLTKGDDKGATNN